MADAFYRVIDDMRVPDRWHLGSPRDETGAEIDIWAFTAAREYVGNPAGISIPIQKKGVALDYTQNAFGTPIVSEKAAEIFARVGGESVQLLPVAVVGSLASHWIVNVLELRDCVDEKQSSFEKFAEDDPIRPDRAGEYSIITKLVIKVGDPSLPQVFRIKGDPGTLVVGESIRREVAHSKLTGIRFWQAYPTAVSMIEFFRD